MADTTPELGAPDGPTQGPAQPEDPRALISDAATAAPELTPRGFRPTKTSIRELQRAVGIRASGDFDAETQVALHLVPSFPGETREGESGNVPQAWQSTLGLVTSGVHDGELTETLRRIQARLGIEETGVGDVGTWAAIHVSRHR